MKYYNVIDILNENEIIIDCGKEQGISKNNTVEVYDKDYKVKDLNGNIIGTYPLIKHSLEIKKVFPKFTVCYAPEPEDITKILSPLSKLPSISYKKILVNIPEDKLVKNPTGAIIKIGDKVSVI